MIKYTIDSKMIDKKETLCVDMRLRLEDSIENRKLVWDFVEKLDEGRRNIDKSSKVKE